MALNLGEVSGSALNWLGGESPHAAAVLDLSFEQDLIRKPVSTFRDRALGAQSLAAAGAARGHDLLAAFGRHPGAKAVAALAHQFARLIGPFHGVISAARTKF
jgi:hypothetical protein